VPARVLKAFRPPNKRRPDMPKKNDLPLHSEGLNEGKKTPVKKEK